MDHFLTFKPCLFESDGRSTKVNYWATGASFTFQALVVGLLFVVSLFQPKALPNLQVRTLLYAPPPVAALRKSVAPPKLSKTREQDTARLRAPSRIPEQIFMPKQEEAPPPPPPEGEVAGGIPGGVVGGTLGGTGQSMLPKVVPRDPVAPTKKLTSSGVVQGNLVHQVKPEYPALARRDHIEGVVVMLAVIDKDGYVRDLRVQSGSPLLAQAAIDAVKQWRYKPYFLNGQPVEVDTRIIINFTLSGR